MKYKKYIKTAIQEMRPYIPGEGLTGVSLSEKDTPEEGGMLAIDRSDGSRWYVSKDFYQKNYKQVKAESMDSKGLSEPVMRLAHLMQHKLDKNKNKECIQMNGDDKGRKWDSLSRKWLLQRLKEEVEELEIELNKGPGHGANIGLECADVANFAMMILDNTGRKL